MKGLRITMGVVGAGIIFIIGKTFVSYSSMGYPVCEYIGPGIVLLLGLAILVVSTSEGETRWLIESLESLFE